MMNNLRWATSQEQARNKCIAAWAEEYNICPYVLRTRIKLGWSIKKAFITSIRKRKIDNE